MPSWQEIPFDSDFTLANFPFGVFSHKGKERRRCGTALGDFVVDLSIFAEAGLFDDVFPEARHTLAQPTLNSLMKHPRHVWVALRNRIIHLFDGTRNDVEHNTYLRAAAIHRSDGVTMHLPATIGDYTDFYSSRNHAENVGTMFRGKDHALQPNWLHLPVGYHGRSSTVVVSGNDIIRPCGQIQKDASDATLGSVYSPCKALDFELEVAFFVGGPENPMGTTMSMEDAHDRIFGYVLMNDWSARDIQKWEYVPLGPFTSKNFATTISPWIVTTMALEACTKTNVAQQKQEPEPLAYIQDVERRTAHSIDLSVSIQGETMDEPVQVTQTNASDLYWTAAQQLVHHSVTGCAMKAGDLLGSGTISSKTQGGSMLELSWKETKEVPLGESGQARKFLHDGDVVIMKGWTKDRSETRIGFGSCIGKVLPSVAKDNFIPHFPVERYTDLKLYNFGLSSASWRIRVVLEAKSIPFKSIIVNLKAEENHAEAFAGQINLMKQVPVLEFKDNGNVVRISQSIAIAEFLEDAFPTRTPLIPKDPVDRARARQICEIVNSGIQPLQNVAYLQDLQLRSEGRIQAADEARLRILKGISALEALVQDYPNSQGASGMQYYSLGGFSPSLADIVLVPQLFNAKSVYGMDLENEFPKLNRILETCLEHPWFVKTHPHMFEK